MVDFKRPTAAEGFTYSTAPQHSPEWVNLRVGKVTASRLGDWLAVGAKGQPLAARATYETELVFEQGFNVPFKHFVTAAMEQGTQMESFLKKEIADIRGYEIESSGAFYSDTFVASPDGLVGDDGLVECKWLYDTKFAQVLKGGVPREHYLQIQGQLWATGRQWCDYVAGNANTKAFKVLRVERDEETIKEIAESVKALPELEAISKEDVHGFQSEPEVQKEVSW